MSIFLCITLILVVAVAAWLRMRHVAKVRASVKVVEVVGPTLEDGLAEIAAELERKIQDIEASGMALTGKSVNIRCSQGHVHVYNEFLRNRSNDSVPDRGLFVDQFNQAFWDPNLGYRGPKHQHLTPGQGMGWVPTSFGCPDCGERQHSFENFEMVSYTTCGAHLVRRGVNECPICAAIHEASLAEFQLRAKQSRRSA
jgi:rubredoxin